MAARLTIHGRYGTPSRHGLMESGRYMLGRDSGADILVDDPRVSREHLLFSHEDGHWRVQDLGSKNGTRLDGRPIVHAILPDAAWLSLGGVPAAWLQTDSAGRPRDELRQRTALALQRPLAPGGDAGQLLQDSMRGMVELTDATAAFLWLSDDAGRLQLDDRLDADKTAARQALGFRDEAIARGELLIAAMAGEGRVRVGLPLILAERLLGAVVLKGARARAMDSSLDRDLLLALASQVALAAGVSTVRDRILVLGRELPAHAREMNRDPGLRRLLRQVFPAYRQSE